LDGLKPTIHHGKSYISWTSISIMEVWSMAKCPKCGTEVEKPIKEWEIQPKRKKGPRVRISLFECPNCKTRFRTAKRVA